MSGKLIWTVDLVVPVQAVADVQETLESFASAVAIFEVPESMSWRLTGYFDDEPDRAEINAAMAIVCTRAGVAPPDIVFDSLESRDWLAESQRAFPMIRVGRYAILNLDDETAPPAGCNVVRLNAGPAFGSGSHATTQGCLALLDGLARTKQVRAPIDLGCGSGILAIAIAVTWHRNVLAIDNDPIAVATTRANAARNGVGPLVSARMADGFRGLRDRLRPHSHDLIVANILANPLKSLADDLERYLERRGVLVLSGILDEQANGVQAHFAARGFRLSHSDSRAGWCSLQMER